MLENLRFEPGETDERPRVLASNLAELGDVYVNDAFGASHRAHASIVGPPPVLPSAGGPAAARARSRCSSRLLDEPTRPFVAVLGGAKVSDKLGVIDALLDRCDTLLIGGAMAFTFLARAGHRRRRLAGRARHGRRLPAPARHRPGADPDRRRDRAGDVGRRRHPHRRRARIPDGWKGLDIGPETAGTFADVVAEAADRALERADGRVRARAVRRRHPHRRRGGRRLSRRSPSSAAATARRPIRQFGLADRVDHVSTGGGASLELIEQGDLPGLAALRERRRTEHE